MAAMTLLRATLLLRATAAGFGPSGLRRPPSALVYSAATRRSERLVAMAVGEATDEKPVVLPTNEDNDQRLLQIRHSTAHLMACAVQKLVRCRRFEKP